MWCDCFDIKMMFWLILQRLLYDSWREEKLVCARFYTKWSVKRILDWRMIIVEKALIQSIKWVRWVEVWREEV